MIRGEIMNQELNQWREKTKGLFNITAYKRFWNYISNLEEENKIKDTNWESLKYYLEKLYYKDYIEEAISDDIDKKIQELESKVEIKGYQKEIKALQQEKDNLYLDYTMLKLEKDIYKKGYEELKELIEKAITEVNND